MLAYHRTKGKTHTYNGTLISCKIELTIVQTTKLKWTNERGDIIYCTLAVRLKYRHRTESASVCNSFLDV